MKIIFDPRPGEIYDIFYSLWLMKNFEYAKERKNGLGIYKDSKYDEMIYNIIKNEKVDIKKIGRYLNKELEPKNIISSFDMWKNPTIDSYLDFIRNLDEFGIRIKIIEFINKVIKEKMNEDEIEKVTEDDNSVLKYIEENDINIKLRWNIYLLLNDKYEYISMLIEFINEYLDTHKILDVERKKVITKFNNNFEKNIKENGIEFLNKLTGNVWDFDNYEKIYITSSVNENLNIEHDLKKNICYVVIGPDIKEFIKYMRGKNSIENNQTFIKNIIEDTKFNIIKLLLKREYFGQELAEAVGITKHNTSYHMNYLVSIGAVNIKRDGQKIYYSANKDALRRSIQLLKKELEL